MYELAPSRKVVLGLLSAGLVCMLAVSLIQRLAGEPLVVQGSGSGMTQAEDPMAAVMSEIGKHMEELKEKPQDFDLLVHTSDLLVQTQQWQAAESFLRRAIAIDATKAQPHYLLGIALHNAEKHAEAAASLEKVVAINEDPSARYSLGVLYAYYLENTAGALEHWKKALENTNVAAELRAAIEDEIKKLEQAPQ